MDYKEKYEQALFRAKQFSEKPYLEDSAGIVEYIFPELASEDERIRKEIIDFATKANNGVTSILANNYDFNKWLAWLEKQSEQKLPDKIKIGQQYKCIASPIYTAFRIGEIYRPENEFLCSLMNLCSKCFKPVNSEKDFVLKDDSPLLSNSSNNGKNAWNEEDEVKINRIVACLENLNVADNDILLKDISWLKSLKERGQKTTTLK